jgi:glyoxylase-like metal-dependent hydrolase (beta-lactamase superfamily II)
VDTVVLTHMHTDHIGWAVERGEPYFRNARYVMQRAEVDAIGRLNPALVEELLTPLGDQLSTVDGDTTLAPDVRVVATPGHTPGHQSVLVGDRLLVTGDLLVHVVQLVDPTLPYAHEVDPEEARRSRERLLRELPPDAILATSHLGEPFVGLPRRQG